MTTNYNHTTPPQETQPTPEQILDSATEFLQHFGVQIDPKSDRNAFLDAIKQLDPRFQGERDLVRWQLEQDTTEWDEDTESIIMATAERFGILKPETQLVGDYDVVISLGAARQANLDRARYAAAAVGSDQATADMLIVTGSDRPLNDQEQSNTANYAPEAATEFDLATGAARVVQAENLGVNVRLSNTEGARATTTDVINKVLSDLASQGVSLDGLRLGAVTTQIYQPFTAIEVAAAAKRFGVTDTFVAGNPSDPEIVARRTPATYLSEILRTLRAAASNVE
jgi:hypothetical protein